MTAFRFVLVIALVALTVRSQQNSPQEPSVQPQPVPPASCPINAASSTGRCNTAFAAMRVEKVWSKPVEESAGKCTGIPGQRESIYRMIRPVLVLKVSHSAQIVGPLLLEWAWNPKLMNLHPMKARRSGAIQD